MALPPHAPYPGAVYQPQWDERSIRVLTCDAVEVMYDCWWPHKPGWGLDSLRGTATYYRISASLLNERAEQIRSEPLTRIEEDVHRPDLPLRLARTPLACWSNRSFSDPEAYAVSLGPEADSFVRTASEERINAAQLVLCPFGPKGARKRGVLVSPTQGTSFSALELLWLAQNIQSPLLREPPAGVGLYRLGFQGGVPSYYLGGQRGEASYLKNPV